MDLLSLLNENARLTNAQLAVMLGKTEEEVEKEIADYQQKGIIKGYKALINWEKVDHHKTTALIELKVQPKKESGFDVRRLRFGCYGTWRQHSGYCHVCGKKTFSIGFGSFHSNSFYPDTL